jgi:hypothetical protein
MEPSIETSLNLGEILPTILDPPTAIHCEDPRLFLHARRPWLLAYLRERLGVRPAVGVRGRRRRLQVPDEVLGRHALAVASSGYGKTRTLLHAARGHIVRGGSLILIDPKGETVDRLLPLLCEAGVPPERIACFDPTSPGPIPGWNPFLEEIPVQQIAGDMASLIHSAVPNRGVRLDELLIQALIVVGSYRLSWLELGRLITDDAYRERLLRSTAPRPSLALREAAEYFRTEFPSWNRSERATTVSSVMNRVRELVRSDFLGPLLNARRNTLRLSDFWREPQILLVKLDRTALGEAGERLLAGLLTDFVFRTALRSPGPTPVLLAIDELPSVARLAEKALTDIVTIARSQNLRLFAATQHLAALPDGLRAALLANCSLRIFLRLGPEDARSAAAALAAGREERLGRVVLESEREDRDTGEVPRAKWSHPILDAKGRPLRLNPPGYEELTTNEFTFEEAVGHVSRLAAQSGRRRLYVRDPVTREAVALNRYIAGVPSEDCRIEGPVLSLVISFPRPRISGTDRDTEADGIRRLARALQDLPVQRAVVSVAGAPPELVRIADVPAPSLSPGRLARYMEEIRKARGQPEGAEALMEVRRREADRIARGENHAASPSSEEILPQERISQEADRAEAPFGTEALFKTNDGSLKQSRKRVKMSVAPLRKVGRRGNASDGSGEEAPWKEEAEKVISGETSAGIADPPLLAGEEEDDGSL